MATTWADTSYESRYERDDDPTLKERVKAALRNTEFVLRFFKLVLTTITALAAAYGVTAGALG